ncbi:hypothetical protein [Beijerinckia sp. L45]|uniref:hypothetical protein n=1 Tax=Beijerinckia sp. L45 TaxID=1641855 RepID=UPI00131A8CEB|nr:hypothetical protein [Beijerinckia sp. L45]
MAKAHLVSVLETKAARTETSIASYRLLMAEAQRDFVDLSAVISLYERGRAPDAVAQEMSFVRIFKRGELFTLCCEALRSNPGGMTITEFTKLCLEAKGLDHSNLHLRRSMSSNLSQIMFARRDRGHIASFGKRGVARLWVLPSKTTRT